MKSQKSSSNNVPEELKQIEVIEGITIPDIFLDANLSPTQLTDIAKECQKIHAESRDEKAALLNEIANSEAANDKEKLDTIEKIQRLIA